MRRAIITGASSGIGEALAHKLASQGVCLGLMARRGELLRNLQNKYPSLIFWVQSDFSSPEQALSDFCDLWNQLGTVDWVFLNAGVSMRADKHSWPVSKKMISVNVESFTAQADEALNRFILQKYGHLIGVSSIAGLRGSGRAPVYGATKAYISNYLQAVRQKVRAVNPHIQVTDIRPGFVDTDLIRFAPCRFWVSSTRKAAEQILEAVERKNKVAYITRRWAIAAAIYAIIPESILEFFYGRYLRK